MCTYPSINATLFYVNAYQFRLIEEAEANPSFDYGQEMVYILDRSPIYSKANTQTDSHSHLWGVQSSQFDLICMSFGCGRNRSTQKKST